MNLNLAVLINKQLIRFLHFNVRKSSTCLAYIAKLLQAEIRRNYKRIVVSDASAFSKI